MYTKQYVVIGVSVLCGNLKKYMHHNKTKYAVKLSGIRPLLHICIKPTYGNGESDSLCRKVCDMHTFGKYAKYAAIAYSHKLTCLCSAYNICNPG